METKSFFFLGAFVLALFLLERRFPLRRASRPFGARIAVNLAMAALTFAVAAVLVRPAALTSIDFSRKQGIGILSALDLPFWAESLLAFALLDLSFYYWHRLNHALPFLWRFHNTHHIDPDLDVSTAFRFHFAEVGFSAVFRTAQVLLIGPTIGLFLAYELCFQTGTFFHHSNVRLPRRLEKFAAFLFVTPRMHGIHHSNYKQETDSNYSVVFSLWDRLHRSFNFKTKQSDIVIGVPGYSNPEDNTIKNALLAPFKRQRDYWRGKIRRIS